MTKESYVPFIFHLVYILLNRNARDNLEREGEGVGAVPDGFHTPARVVFQRANSEIGLRKRQRRQKDPMSDYQLHQTDSDCAGGTACVALLRCWGPCMPGQYPATGCNPFCLIRHSVPTPAVDRLSFSTVLPDSLSKQECYLTRNCTAKNIPGVWDLRFSRRRIEMSCRLIFKRLTDVSEVITAHPSHWRWKQ
jgi:hypothetical protein